MIHHASTILTALILIGLPVDAFAASQRIVCNGNVSIFGDTGGTHLKELNPKAKGFKASDREVNFLRVGLKPGQPLVDIIPWGGITQHPYKDNPHAKDIFVQFKTDGRTWFSVSLTGRASKNQKRLACAVRPDLEANKNQVDQLVKSAKPGKSQITSREPKKRSPAHSRKTETDSKR